MFGGHDLQSKNFYYIFFENYFENYDLFLFCFDLYLSLPRSRPYLGLTTYKYI